MIGFNVEKSPCKPKTLWGSFRSTVMLKFFLFCLAWVSNGPLHQVAPLSWQTLCAGGDSRLGWYIPKGTYFKVVECSVLFSTGLLDLVLWRRSFCVYVLVIAGISLPVPKLPRGSGVPFYPRGRDVGQHPESFVSRVAV